MINRVFSGQSAIEYLMTYGWMLLVVAVVGGAVFSLAQGDSPETVSGFTGSDVQIDDFGVTENNNLQLELTDGSGQGSTVSAINITDEDTGKFVYKEFGNNNAVDVGGETVFELPNISRSDSGSLEVTVFYDTGGLTNLSVSGSISGGFAVDETTELTGGGSGGSPGFQLVESFESGNLDDYSGNKSYFNVVSGGVNGSNAIRTDKVDYENQNHFIWRDGTGADFTKGQTLRYWTNTTTAWYEGLTFGLESVKSGYQAKIYDGCCISLDRVDDGSATGLDSKSVDISNPHHVEIVWESDGNITLNYYESDQFQNINSSISAVDNTYSGDDIGWFLNNPGGTRTNAEYDYVRVKD